MTTQQQSTGRLRRTLLKLKPAARKNQIRGAAIVAVAAVVSLAGAGFAAVASADDAPRDDKDLGAAISPSQYALMSVDSESAPYPAPPAVDGTAMGAFDNDFDTQWATRYNGGNPDPLPHYLVVDVGGSFDLTALQYSVKVQDNGPVKGYEVYATDSKAVAENPVDGAWGAPVAKGDFRQPTSKTEVQVAAFDAPVKARYVKFVATSTVNGTANVSASEIRVMATGDTTPPVTPPGGIDDPATPVVITNGAGLNVSVAKEFPQVISYDLGGKTMNGKASILGKFIINGDAHAATTSMTSAGNRAEYVSTFATFPNLTITSAITVNANGTVDFEMEELAGTAAMTVNEISIPDHSLISVDSSEPGATMVRTKIDTDSNRTADQFIAITSATPVDSAAVGTPYAFVNNQGLAAGILTNATDDSAQSNNDNWNFRQLSRIVDAGGGARRAELSVGKWTYSPKEATDSRVSVYRLPKATVVLAADGNGDSKVDWQDGALAYRAVMERPIGAERVPERVIQRIPFNFASQATNPFLKTLENVKRVSMATDNLGQWNLEKGYGDEGHDSAHPDFGGNYNTRAGGLEDFNTLLSVGKEYNADFGVHVNATETYPQAYAFSDRLIQGKPMGWNWLNQAYHIDQRYDLGQGGILDRFQQLRNEAPDLKTVYIDAYYSSGWLADGLAKELYDMGFEVSTEWSYKFEGTSIWSHWANDKNYGGSTNKGINSNIVRFIANTDRDVWNIDPLLGGVNMKDFEGWTGQINWNTFYGTLWSDNLPTKFLQHYPVQSWDFGKVANFTDGVKAEMVGGKREISMDGVVVARGADYLLPWGDVADSSQVSSPSDADKMYFYTEKGGSHTFELTSQFSGNSDFKLYELTDQGRSNGKDVRAVGGKVTVTGDPAKPYVLVPTSSKAPHDDANYGEGGAFIDPGFNSGSLDAWKPTGGVSIARSALADNVAKLGTDASSISQDVTGLKPGVQYTVSADIEISKGLRRDVTISAAGLGLSATNAFDSTPLLNQMASDTKGTTYSQRARVTFIAPADGKVTIKIEGAAGPADVFIDDLRLMTSDLSWSPTTGPSTLPDGTIISLEDFEGNQPGWGPFIKGNSGGRTDPRTSISRLNEPYSQKTWKNANRPFNSGALNGLATDDVITESGGTHSLKSHDENTGLVYRTVPATVPFKADHRYRVEFDYQVSTDAEWAWVVGADTVGGGNLAAAEVRTSTFAPARETTRFSQEFIAGCGDTWVGLRKTASSPGSDFTMDNFRVVDLGEATGGAACGVISAPNTVDFSPDVPTPLVTSFTNHEAEDATNVGLTLEGVPSGWKVEVADKGGNHFDTVKPGETVRTTWVVTAPAAAAGTSAVVKPTATYFANCSTKSVDTEVRAVVPVDNVLSPTTMTATASSQHAASGTEGPAKNVLDGDISTIWHTRYSPAVDAYPHTFTLDLQGEAKVDGFGYLNRQDGGQNGWIKDYTISVSDNGSDWTQVASGAFAGKSATMQRVTFAEVKAKFVKMTALNSHNGQAFASAAEIRVYGTPSVFLTGFEPTVRPADEACAVPTTPVIDIPDTVEAGTDLPIRLSGFAADTELVVELHSDPVVLGTVTTDAAGAAVLTARIPAGTSAGAHEVVVTDAAGAKLAAKAITVSAAKVPEPGTGTGPGDPKPGEKVPGAGGSSLPVTGVAILGTLVLASGLLGAGYVLRRRRGVGE